MSSHLEEHLRELEERHLKLDVRNSYEHLNAILADEFWEIGSSGYPYDKKECLESGVVLSEMTLHNFKIQSLAEGVTLTTYFVADQTRKRNTLRSSIWKYIDQRWQLYFHQGTITDLEVNCSEAPQTDPTDIMKDKKSER
ncbi:DUF4440 domain-containing protein [Halobacillus rhizosphaerae]|uniref:nuclear transport factor 2 family protein n=1 Tax=Halobacillus rhizosphaerae TaxID=3064889 RepID=UPI00398ADECC